MNPACARLHPYPFERLKALVSDVRPGPGDPIVLTMGEPRHAPAPVLKDALQAAASSVSAYPPTAGTRALREAIATWANQRHGLGRMPLDPDRHVLGASGTREALFAVAQVAIDSRATPPQAVLMPNPFYQIYEGAALLAGGEPIFLNTLPANGYRMELCTAPGTVPESVLARTRLLYVCSPGNPAGNVLKRDDYAALIELAERHDFLIASDECYSEIYHDEDSPPVGLLSVAMELGITDYRRCLMFQSLSKRSNLPGLRSGFIAGDGEFLKSFLQYRTYSGCALSGPAQSASIAAWRDETHVRDNRALYRAKFDAVLDLLSPVLPVARPDAGFYLWTEVPGGGEAFARGLYAAENVLVLPGSYLSRVAHGLDPGAGRVRIALVGSLAECREAALRIRRFTESL